MHRILTILAALLLTATTAQAKREPASVFMFGFAASFNDTIVHITNIQQVDSAWLDSRNDFLLGRDQYSWQLKQYLTDSLAMPHRTCAVFYATTRKAIDKQYARITKLYYMGRDGHSHYDVRRLQAGQFAFRAVDMSQEPEAVEQEPPAPAPKADKKKPKKDRKDRKDRKDKKPRDN